MLAPMVTFPVINQDRRKVSALARTLQVHVFTKLIIWARFLYFITLFTGDVVLNNCLHKLNAVLTPHLDRLVDYATQLVPRYMPCDIFGVLVLCLASTLTPL